MSAIRKAMQILALEIGLTTLGTLMALVAYKWVPVTNTCYMKSMNAKSGAKEIVQKWVPLSDISPKMVTAVVSSEDNLFVRHNGFCWEAIKKAREENKKRKKARGASSISQQTAKNVFLNNSHSYVRKALEAALTVGIELVWGKERIMEVYLNVIEQGPGIYGVEASAQKNFHHSAKTITSSEAALMAAVLPNPIKFKIGAPSPYMLKRQQQIETLMRKIGTIRFDTDAKSQKSQETPKKSKGTKPKAPNAPKQENATPDPTPQMEGGEPKEVNEQPGQGIENEPIVAD